MQHYAPIFYYKKSVFLKYQLHFSCLIPRYKVALKISVTAGGASATSFEADQTAARQRPCPLLNSPGEARLHNGASKSAVAPCCLLPVWNTGRFAATNVAARAGAKAYITHSAINTVPLQSAILRHLDFNFITTINSYISCTSSVIRQCLMEQTNCKVPPCRPVSSPPFLFSAWPAGLCWRAFVWGLSLMMGTCRFPAPACGPPWPEQACCSVRRPCACHPSETRGLHCFRPVSMTMNGVPCAQA